MAIAITRKSAIFPWLDATEDVKYIKGEHGKTSDRWAAAPKYLPCWKGDYREWHITDGVSSQTQCYCKFWKKHINANLAACVRCEKRAWPETELWKEHLLIELQTVSEKATAVLDAVTSGALQESDALEIGRVLGFDEIELDAEGTVSLDSK